MNDLLLIALIACLVLCIGLIVPLMFVLSHQRQQISDLMNRLMARNYQEFARVQEVKTQIKPNGITKREPVPEKETKPCDPVLGGKY